MDPNSKSAYLGSGFPLRGSKVHDFMVIAEDLDLAITSSSLSVTSAGPAVLKTQVSNFTPAISVEISAIFYANPIFFAQFFGSFAQFLITLACSLLRKPFLTAILITLSKSVK